MPKLNTTIDNLELKSNKVINATPSAAWTDAQYPSAKTLYNVYTSLLNTVHPIGRVLVTSENKNPSETLGGTWELVDKGFKTRYFTLPNATYWHNHLSSVSTSANSYIAISDHEVKVHINMTASMDITNTSAVALGQVMVSECGISALPKDTVYYSAQTAGTVSSVAYTVKTDGTVTSLDAIAAGGEHKLPKSTNFCIDFTLPATVSIMQDAAWDKFYWKRTA